MRRERRTMRPQTEFPGKGRGLARVQGGNP